MLQSQKILVLGIIAVRPTSTTSRLTQELNEYLRRQGDDDEITYKTLKYADSLLVIAKAISAVCSNKRFSDNEVGQVFCSKEVS